MCVCVCCMFWSRRGAHDRTAARYNRFDIRFASFSLNVAYTTARTSSELSFSEQSHRPCTAPRNAFTKSVLTLHVGVKALSHALCALRSTKPPLLVLTLFALVCALLHLAKLLHLCHQRRQQHEALESLCWA